MQKSHASPALTGVVPPVCDAEAATMNAIADALARWYADHSSIRRLWAIDEPAALRVLVTLEPTSDGDDTLPVWLANNRGWANDLRLLVRRDVQLQLLVPGAFGESDASPDPGAIAHLSWRDCWISS